VAEEGYCPNDPLIRMQINDCVIRGLSK
jgi:hypothetical protein